MEEVTEVIIYFIYVWLRKKELTTRNMKGMGVTLYIVMQDRLNKLYFNVRQKRK